MSTTKTKLVTSFYLLILGVILILSALSFVPAAKKASSTTTEVTDQEGPKASAQEEEGDVSIFTMMLNSVDGKGTGTENEVISERVLVITYRFFFAVLLSGMLAFRPKKDSTLFQRNYHVAQTQILLAVVAAALMMIVGNNAARAFAIFAAVSLVRFRTNIRDPKEITVLLVSLAIGLAAGIGRWELGAILCLFVMGLLWILEFKEDEKTFRSMELTIKTADIEKTRELLEGTFERFELSSELRKFNADKSEDSSGKITYYLTLSLDLTTEYLSDLLLQADSDNIKDIRWKHKRNEMHIYQ